MSDLGESPLPVLEEESTIAGFARMSAEEIPDLPILEVHPGGNGKRAPDPAPVRRVLEAVLFAVDRPVTVEQLLFALPGRDPEEIEAELKELARSLKDQGSGFQLCETGGGYQLRTDPQMHEYVARFLVGKKRVRLSRAAMETVAIVAYRQPITRGEMEEIRGVDCGQVLHTLLERNLVTIRGRSQALGRPLLYGTTDEFLHYFGINSLADLPSPEELGSLLGEDPLQDPEVRVAMEARGLIMEPADGEPLPEEAAPERALDFLPGSW
jgi:segregation and condensation protein B